MGDETCGDSTDDLSDVTVMLGDELKAGRKGPASSFTDPDAVARYRDGPPRQVPGFADLQRMTELLLAERTPEDGRVLVLGAGGGLELEHLAAAHAGWEFDGVDPSAEMLRLAQATTQPFAARIRLPR